jgi:hypothetical protein
MILALSALLLLQADDLPSATLDSAIKAISGYHERTTTKPADDDAFLKRLYADLLGGPPTNAELQAFVADVLPKKRAAAIDQLVTDDRFNDFWARRFTRVFFGDPDKLRIDDMPGVETAAVRNFERWLSAEFKKDTPWTDIVYRILNARGGLDKSPEAAYALSFNRGEGITVEFPQGVAKHFLGIRLYCAKCHDHAYDKWRVEDFYGLSSFIVGQQASMKNGIPEIAYAENGNARLPILTGRVTAEVKFAAGGTAEARFLFGGTVAAGADRMTTLAQFMTQKANTQLPRAFANRVWGWIYGRGIVDPVDDFNLKNKADSTAVMESLVRDQIANGYSLKRLIRTICNTKDYQLQTPEEAPDGYSFRHHLAVRYALGGYAYPVAKGAPLSVEFTTPETWVRVRKRIGTSGARMLFRVPDPKNPTRNAELWVYETKQPVPNALQYVRPKTQSTALSGKLPTTLEELSGTYTCLQFADGPVEWTVLAANLEPSQGKTVAFRLEGPPDVVASCRGDFEALLKGAAPPR